MMQGKKVVYFLWAHIIAMPVLYALDALDQEEQAYQRIKRTRICRVEGLAGNYQIALCDLINRFKQVLTDSTPYRNALLLHGPPGTGKTTIAGKIADMTGAQFIHRSAAGFVTYKQGSGAQMVRDIFEKDVDPALKNGKVILFVDEIDAFTRKRTGSESEDHLNTLLELMQKITEYRNQRQLLIVVATNNKEILDDAMLSRIRRVEISLPDRHMCYEIFEHYLSQYVHKLTQQQIQELASHAHTAHLSGRDIEAIVQDASIRSTAVGATKVLFGVLSDITDEICKQNEVIYQKKEAEEIDKKNEKEIRDLQLKALKHEENERFYQRFIAPEKDDRRQS